MIESQSSDSEDIKDESDQVLFDYVVPSSSSRFHGGRKYVLSSNQVDKTEIGIREALERLALRLQNIPRALTGTAPLSRSNWRMWSVQWSKYFIERFDLNSGILKMELELFRCLKLFNPENHKHNEYGAEDIEKLCRFTPFQSMQNDLIKELPVMKRLAANFESSHDILLWFKQRSDEIGTWYEAAKLCALIQPSSGSAERAFSLLEIAQNENQSSSLLDYQETSIMLRYNRQMREVESKWQAK
jgi:hypothetical protein